MRTTEPDKWFKYSLKSLLDARNYAGGIYFYSLEVDGYYEVKKMMLLR
jgi:hypothetical protein